MALQCFLPPLRQDQQWLPLTCAYPFLAWRLNRAFLGCYIDKSNKLDIIKNECGCVPRILLAIPLVTGHVGSFLFALKYAPDILCFYLLAPENIYYDSITIVYRYQLRLMLWCCFIPYSNRFVKLRMWWRTLRSPGSCGQTSRDGAGW
jgi:hypothetical protein